MREAEARDHIGRGVEQLFAAAAHLDDAELTMVRAIWESQDTVRRDVAWAKAKAHIRHTKRGRLLTAATDRLAEWTNGGGEGSYAGPWGHSMAGGSSNIRRQTLAALLDAAAAVIAADGLPDEDRTLLMRPLRKVTAQRGGRRV